MISRVCEEFHCTPPQAVDVLERCEALVFDILELRAYANTKQACDDADASDGKIKPPKGPLSDMVYQIEYDLLQARHAQMTDE